MAIAILGWGSLLWDIDNLAPHVQGNWRMQGGPALPMEFSRISPKRRMGLVVCLDADHGSPCATHAITSTRASLAEAQADLALRERAPLARIGYADHKTGFGRLPVVVELVQNWCKMQGWAGAVWTDLEPNFADHTGQAFTLPAALAYLKTCQGEDLAEAYRYIQNAPIWTDTPLRRHLAVNTWWQSLNNADFSA